MISNEQKLVDICFEIALTIQEYPSDFQELSSEDMAKWVASQLAIAGFNTTACGSSWGILNK